MRTWIAAALALLAAPAAALALEEPPGPKPASVEEAFYGAFYRENGLRDFEAAAEAYAGVAEAARAAGRKDLLVRALLGRGRCLRTMGKIEAAKESFAKALEADPGNAEAKAALESGPAAGGEGALDGMIEGWVRGIADLGEGRARAMANLKVVGNRAVPGLSAALRELEIEWAQGAAQVLAEINTPESLAALAGAFTDPGVRFPGVLVGSLRSLTPGPEALGVFVAALRGTSGKARAQVLDVLRTRLPLNNWIREVDLSVFGRIHREAFADPSAEVRVAALRDLQLFNPMPATLLREVGIDRLADLLGDPDPGVVGTAATVLHQWVGSAWDDALSAKVLDLVERTVRGEVKAQQPWHYIQMIMNPSTRRFPEGRLFPLFLMASGTNALDDNQSTALRNQIVSYLQAAAERDEPRRAALVAAGWRALGAAPARILWVEAWQGKGGVPAEVLLLAAKDPDPRLRRTAYAGLPAAALPPEDVGEAFPFLVRDLGAEEVGTRRAAFMVAARFKVPELGPGLREFHAKAAPGQDRDAVLAALVNTLGREALPEIRADLATDDWWAARDALVNLLGEEAVPDLVALAARLKDPFSAICSRPHQPNLVIAGKVLEAYLDALPSEADRDRLFSATVRSVGRERQRAMVLAVLGAEESPHRFTAIVVAREARIQEAWPHLLALLDGPDKNLRDAAQQALQEIRTYRELKSSFERFREGDAGKAFADAAALLKSEDPVKRRGGALALGALGDRAGVPLLLGLLDDGEASVREAALEALERLGGKPR